MVQSRIEKDTLAIDYSRCPLPKTHRRLVEAHVLWHQSLEQYHQPDLFQANLNATIQALRNITFILQSEKHSFTQFEDWYKRWQERIKADSILRWLKEARNTVVKQGELETSSMAVVKLVAWKDDVLVEMSIPPDTPPSLILRNIPLFELVNNTHLPPGDLEHAVIIIERRWSVTDLGGQEILEALAQAYGLLSDLVLDAHVKLGETGCISSNGTHPHFRSTYHPSGTLPCMVVGSERRSHSFSLQTGQEIEMIRTISPGVDPAIAAKRYGLEQMNKMPGWQTADPLLIAEKVLFTAKRILRKDKVLVRMAFIRDGRGTWHQVALEASNRTEKHLLMRMVARYIESVGGDVIIDVNEVWILPPENAAVKAHFDDARYVPGRGEALSVLVATREGLFRSYITPFTRGPFGGIKLGDTIEAEEHPYYLKPVSDVWQIQGTTYSPDGKLTRRLWEPDHLDTCFCGGPRQFAECCKQQFDMPDWKSTKKQEIHEAIAVRDPARFEELARAELAQYVIWVKQHTSPTRHVAPELHRMFVEVDVPALTAHVGRLGEALMANGHSDSFLPQLRHIAKVIGVPELSIRLTALAAQWSFTNGDYSTAVKEMETLGDLERLNDPLALILAVRLLDLPAHKQTQFLKIASGALWDYERWLAELELAGHLADCSKRDEALRRVDSVITELAKKSGYEGLRADAMALRWHITKDEQDFRAAKSELEKTTNSEHPQHLAAILIDHGDYDEAERILSDAVTACDPEAQLLIVDTRIRANRIDSARDLLLTIAPDSVTPNLQLPYAVAYALVALASEDDKLKKVAAAKLQNLPAKGTRVAKYVNDFLEALDGREITRQKPPVIRFRDFFLRWG
jgi:hypothetical protein